MMTCNTILGSWQDILRKTFLASGNKTTKCFCQCLSMSLALMSVHQGLALGTSRPSSFPWLFPSHHHLHCCKATSGACSCTYAHVIICLFRIAQLQIVCSGRSNCSQYVKEAEAPGAWAPGGSEKAGGNVSPFPWEWPHHPHP